MTCLIRYWKILCLASASLILCQCENDPGLVDPYSLESWEKFTTSNGLSSNQITSLKCDSRGNLWVGTLEDGIMIFDGRSWAFLDEKDGIANNTILAIEEDAAGRMWFGTFVGISLYDGSSFTNLYYQSETQPVHDIHRDRNENMWLATSYKGLLKLEGLDRTTVYSLDGVPGSDSVHCIEEDQTGTIWAGTQGGVFKISGSRVEFLKPGEGIPENPVQSILSDNWGNVWFGSLGDRHVVRLSNGIFNEISLFNTKEVNLVYDMLEAPCGDIWLGLGNAGAVRYDGSSMETFRDFDGLPGNTILCMECDHQGQIWFGSYKNGLSVYRPGLRDVIPPIE